MKRNKNQIKVISLFIIAIFLAVISVYTNVSFANANTPKIIVEEMNPKFLEWNQLPDEEKSKTIMPMPIEITFKDSIKRSTYNSILRLSLGENNPISRYDLRTELREIIVKNQQQTGDCWAFSTTSMIETVIAKKYNKQSKEYSPMHLEYFVSNNFKKAVGAGANHHLAQAYLAGGKGPIYESELSFSSVYDEEKNLKSNYYLKPKDEVSINKEVRAQLKESIYFASICKKYDSTTNKPIYMDITGNEYTETQVLGFRNLVKNHIQTSGAVNACYHAPDGLTYDAYMKEYLSFYNENTMAYYCYDTSLDSNHQITIIGWDDNYSKENFVNQPANDGAWIVLNSWGEEFGEDGYLYISYDDCHIEEGISGIIDISETEEDGSLGYDNLYEYDPLGCSNAIGYGEPSIWAANIFTRKDISKDEYLNSVGIFLWDTCGVEVYVNTDCDGSKDNINNELTDLTKVATLTGTNALLPGYHTIDITPLKLTGTKFIVAIKYINEDGAMISIEMNHKDTKGALYSNYWDTATSNPGESFFSDNGRNWYEINGTKLGWTATITNTNACIKAFTVEQESVTIPVTDVTLNKTQENLKIGDTLVLTATVTPDNATNQNVIWSSSDTNIATVSDSGVVTAVAEGKTTITVTTSDGGKTATCSITVQKPIVNVTGITLNKNSAEMDINSTLQLIATITPENATDKNVTWTTSNSNIAKVSTSGVVTAVSAGTATITATTVDGGKIANCDITVKTPIINVTGVSLNRVSDELEIGATVQLIATITPENATDKNVNWSSSNSNIATVSTSGVVTAVSAGTATITATTVDGGKTANYTVIVKEAAPANVSVTGVTLNKTQATLKIGDTLSLIPTIAPNNATNQNVSWSSSDVNIATVSGGVVTAVSEGTATITVTTEDGQKTATCVVTVETPVVNVTGVTLNKTQATLKIGDTLSLIPTITPNGATNQNVSWSSSDVNIATVSGGVVTAISEGTATITVTTEDGQKTATCVVTIETPVVSVTGVSLNKSIGKIKQGSTLQLVATITPPSATNKDITWSTSNPEVATVMGGVVTGVAEGTATITVTTVDGAKTAVCTVTVEENTKIIPVTSVALTVDKISLEVGNKFTFVAQINPPTATNKKLTWISSDDTVVEVSDNGLITAKKEGTATITVITDDGLYTDSVEVTVNKKVNHDDDIYTDPGDDEDTLPGDLPETGEKFTIIAIIAIIFIACIVFIIKFKKYDLK